MEAFTDQYGLLNDIYSYPKDLEVELSHSNGVSAVMAFLDCDTQSAIDILADLTNLRTRQFQQIIAEEIPQLVEDARLDEATRDRLDDYITRLRQWLTGQLSWYVGDPPRYPPTRRYDLSAAHAGITLPAACSGHTGPSGPPGSAFFSRRSHRPSPPGGNPWRERGCARAHRGRRWQRAAGSCSVVMRAEVSSPSCT
ncbi:hypothetical protein HII36_37185 [Nonomuraea sp. NN258]|uniref:terpene synthase family protein n=1 Tax=Nonomuraea antri TaxID=2730852 RepID=UPI001569A73C|nr:hypothetical protein [Nonomuraea antri]NRQ37428.1 hypothetical protein [Nonomuraea antri]